VDAKARTVEILDTRMAQLVLRASNPAPGLRKRAVEILDGRMSKNATALGTLRRRFRRSHARY